ncbi:DUF1963 domain-containing protein [Kordia sp. YSTF-M3]|uniref:DUF1963 domain-containing protein n=1 Tax=Kordia aestuariivivens TaxID=2759037 RepID=A0ABR7Q5S8_9FLAO|nr:DUF1963 domain-containing protein [Kordia aestuariivivens]MBC8753925.1 DUF1963 domain-containing protein [Kordia aestuariivivens]
MYNKIKKTIINSFPLQFELVEEILKPSIGIVANEKQISSNKFSKFGGFPIVNKNHPLLSFLDFNYSMLCQINIIELKKIDIEYQLPNQGILYFFINPNLTKFTSDNYKVVFIEGNGDFEFIKEERVSEVVYNESEINFFEHYTFPSYQEKSRLKISDKIDDDIIESIYEEVCEITGKSLEIGHQILGEPQATQGTVKYWWALQSLGYAEFESLNNSQKQEISNLQEDFILLLQIDLEDPNLSFTNLETGALYFGILKDDLKNKNFDNVVLVYQSS